jgi:opacity protein-like surface antigen
MRFKLFVSPLLTLCLITAAAPAFSQVAPAYQTPGIPLTIGAGGSNYDVDWGHGRMWGTTVWADWYPGLISSHIRGLGFEAEGRDISIGQTLPAQKNIRQDTAAAGGIYSLRRFRNFQPYAKFLIGVGSYDFTSSSRYYNHDTRALMAGGGGIQYRVFGPIWARADYEYQVWQQLFGGYPDPQGFTAGFSYDFSHPQGR